MSREQMAAEVEGASILLSSIMDTTRVLKNEAEGDLAIRIALLAGALGAVQSYVENIKIMLEGENAEN